MVRFSVHCLAFCFEFYNHNVHKTKQQQKTVFTTTPEIHARSLANFYILSICGQTHEFEIRATR